MDVMCTLTRDLRAHRVPVKTPVNVTNTKVLKKFNETVKGYKLKRSKITKRF